jgi:hypothetical protein
VWPLLPSKTKKCQKQSRKKKGSARKSLLRLLRLHPGHVVRIHFSNKKIANAVNTYNLLLLSEKLVATDSEQDRQILLKKILTTSTHSWAHINLVGEYDFSDGKDYKIFDLGSIMDLNLTP